MWNLRWNEYGEMRTRDDPKPRKRLEVFKKPKKKAKKKGKARVVDYGERNEILKELGYADYAEYLNSPLWSKIRRKVFARDEAKCRVCGKRGEQVHHQSYDRKTLKGVRIGRLLLLCKKCHEQIERDPLGRKRSARDAASEAKARVRKARKPRIRIHARERHEDGDMETEFLRAFGRSRLEDFS